MLRLYKVYAMQLCVFVCVCGVRHSRRDGEAATNFECCGSRCCVVSRGKSYLRIVYLPRRTYLDASERDRDAAIERLAAMPQCQSVHAWMCHNVNNSWIFMTGSRSSMKSTHGSYFVRGEKLFVTPHNLSPVPANEFRDSRVQCTVYAVAVMSWRVCRPSPGAFVVHSHTHTHTQHWPARDVGIACDAHNPLGGRTERTY